MFKGPKCVDTSTPITERYDPFEKAVAEVAEKVIGSENTVECRAGC